MSPAGRMLLRVRPLTPGFHSEHLLVVVSACWWMSVIWHLPPEQKDFQSFTKCQLSLCRQSQVSTYEKEGGCLCQIESKSLVGIAISLSLTRQSLTHSLCGWRLSTRMVVALNFFCKEPCDRHTCLPAAAVKTIVVTHHGTSRLLAVWVLSVAHYHTLFSNVVSTWSCLSLMR